MAGREYAAVKKRRGREIGRISGMVPWKPRVRLF